jgi:hypothetical protein
MGVMLGARTNNDDPATKGDAPGATTTEEEPEIEEINQAPMEIVQPQCIRVARKRHEEWVFHEEYHFDSVVCKLQCTVDDLMS